MPFYVYSEESFPNKHLQGKPSYTPEYLQHFGITLTLPEREWVKLPDNFYTLRHADWKDRAGSRQHVAGDDLISVLRNKFKDRGIIFVDHEPSAKEKVDLERQAHETNMAYRMTAIEWYEAQVREKEVTGQGRTRPTAYEDQCYSVLGVTKPYSVEAMRAQRHPGEAVGEQIVAALERLEARRHAEHKPAPAAAK